MVCLCSPLRSCVMLLRGPLWSFAVFTHTANAQHTLGTVVTSDFNSYLLLLKSQVLHPYNWRHVVKCACVCLVQYEQLHLFLQSMPVLPTAGCPPSYFWFPHAGKRAINVGYTIHPVCCPPPLLTLILPDHGHWTTVSGSTGCVISALYAMT